MSKINSIFFYKNILPIIIAVAKKAPKARYGLEIIDDRTIADWEIFNSSITIGITSKRGGSDESIKANINELIYLKIDLIDKVIIRDWCSNGIFNLLENPETINKYLKEKLKKIWKRHYTIGQNCQLNYGHKQVVFLGIHQMNYVQLGKIEDQLKWFKNN